MIVLDTNVLSEILRRRPEAAAKDWLQTQPSTSLFITTICEAEIFYGLALMRVGHRRAALELAITAIFDEDFSHRVLPFDSAAARSFAKMRRRSGHPIRDFDARIAAIAHSRGAAVATRNVKDFSNCGIKVINPWE